MSAVADGLPLPDSWAGQPLSRLCAEVAERVDPASLPHDLVTHYIGLEHIGQGSGRLDGMGNAADVVSQKSRFWSGDILYGKLRPNLRKVVRPCFDGVCSTDVIVFRAKKTADPDFLFQVLQSEPLVAHAITTAAGTKMPRTHARSILSFEIAVPPLDEQRRIAGVLRSVDEVIAYSQQVLFQLSAAKVAERKDAFGVSATTALDPTLAKQGWSRTRLGKVFKERKQKGIAGLPVASVSIEQGLVFRADLDRRVVSSLPAEGHSLVRKYDLAYNMMRMWQGACGIASMDCIVSPAYVVMTPTPDIDPRFAHHMLRSEPVIALLHAYSQGIVDDRLRLYPQAFDQIPINLPPLVIQREIAELLDAYGDYEAVVAKELAATENMKSALMSDLLSGRVRVPA